MPENTPEEIPHSAEESERGGGHRIEAHQIERVPFSAQSGEVHLAELSLGSEQELGAENIATQEASPPDEPTRSVRTIFVVAAGWIVPGLGHLVQRRIGRALAAFFAVGMMALLGFWMRGNVFPPHGDDAFGVLGFLADAGSGMFYFLAHTIEKAGPDVSRAAGDYGTRLVATAGVLNLLFVLDALEISRGRKA